MSDSKLDLEKIQVRADDARTCTEAGVIVTGPRPEDIVGMSTAEARDICAESAADVPELIAEVRRLRAQREKALADAHHNISPVIGWLGSRYSPGPDEMVKRLWAGLDAIDIAFGLKPHREQIDEITHSSEAQL